MNLSIANELRQCVLRAAPNCQMRLRAWPAFVVTLLVASGSRAQEAGPSSFDARIAPLLSRHCLECHNASDRKGGLDLAHREAAMAGGDSGAVIVSGNVEQSLLWRRVSTGEMPPETPLANDEIEVLR